MTLFPYLSSIVRLTEVARAHSAQRAKVRMQHSSMQQELVGEGKRPQSEWEGKRSSW